MKITAVKTYVLEASLGEHGFGWSQRVTHRRQSAICVVDTDEGIQGLGEAFYFGGPANVVATLVDDGLGPLVIGHDPMDTSVLWDRLYNWTRDQGQKGLTISAISAVDIALMVDANHAYNASEAVRLARVLADYDVYWFEEPVVPEDLDGYMEVRAASDVPIAGGECEYTRYGFRQLIDCRAVDILQPDLCGRAATRR